MRQAAALDSCQARAQAAEAQARAEMPFDTYCSKRPSAHSWDFTLTYPAISNPASKTSGGTTHANDGAEPAEPGLFIHLRVGTAIVSCRQPRQQDSESFAALS